MKLNKAILLSSLAAMMTVSLQAGQTKYSNEQIYDKMCQKCHGINAEGNPKKKGPALDDQSAHELEISLFDLRSGGLNQSSGSDHDVMEHNMKQIIKKGMDYEPKSMAEYIFVTFNEDAKYYKKITTKKSYTVSEIYGKMCSKCHGMNGEGNPKKKGPSLDDKTAHEIEADLIDIINGDMNQSSGTDHDVMEHNSKKIKEKGMVYDPKEMAEYIQTHFYKE